MMLRLVLLGAPGVGKGTQAKKLVKDFGVAHISTGEMLRNAIQAKSDLGSQVRQYVEKGGLVPDEIMAQLVESRFAEYDCKKGYILDGYPRTLEQARFLDQVLRKAKMPINGVISLDVDSEEIIKRLSSRLTCDLCGYISQGNRFISDECPECGGRLVVRKDDEPATIKHRLEVYRERTEKVIGYYRKSKLLHCIDGRGSSDDVYNRILLSLGLKPNAI